jgi:hypothetical protein
LSVDLGSGTDWAFDGFSMGLLAGSDHLRASVDDVPIGGQGWARAGRVVGDGIGTLRRLMPEGATWFGDF